MRYANILFLFVTLCSSLAFAADLPDPVLTPGVVDPEVYQADLKETICKPGHNLWSDQHTPPKSYLEGMELELLRSYGYADENIHHYQMDHLVPIALGGSPTDPKNIWPQLLVSKWSARRKDYLESVLHDKVCKGEITLREAQGMIQTNWIDAYTRYIGNPDQHP